MRGVFFFQAEDGIRDLVRSRGVGDVYKRQIEDGRRDETNHCHDEAPLARCVNYGDTSVDTLDAVSYTHLTLPTSDLV